MPAGVCAAGALLRYAARTQSQALAHVQSLSAERPGQFAYAVLAAGWLPHAHGQPAAAPVAAPSAARKRAGTGAPASHLRAAGRPHGRRTDVRFGRPAGSAARGAECLPRHRTHRRTPGAALGAPA
ncbi:hypothetical protein G6F68_016964 [Rhizopus microsporus]|nr:hypothetical protein G6F68_016964 [Rhizopus microsporus]